MPEIAEVRTVARTLNKRIVGKKIIDVETYYDGIIQDDYEYFRNNVINREITKVHNFGKYLFIELGDKTIVSHLRMEGKYFIKDIGQEVTKHEHVVFMFLDDTDLRYHDTRKFGTMRVVDTTDIYELKEIKKLGIEPDSDALTKEYIYENISNSKKPIKTLLLDQTIINGLGNIYVDEVLHKSGINPEESGTKITLDDCEKIKESCKDIIEKATLGGGTTIRSYTSSLNVYGTYQEHLKVHTKEVCGTCNNKVTKIRVGGRGTYFCDSCQKKKK